MTEQPLLTETIQQVQLITLNRPDAANAFNTALRAAAVQALNEAAADDSIGAVVLTGAGKSFSAGIDLRELASLTGSQMGKHSPDEAAAGSAANDSAADSDTSGSASGTGDSWALLQLLESFPKPLIMAVNGAAVGLGTTMLGFADLVFASEQARFKCPFTELGVGAEAASTWLLPQLLGWQNAAWMLLSSEWVLADHAKELGLVFKVCPPDEFLDQAVGAAQSIASKDLAAALAIKRTMHAWRKAPIETTLKLESSAFMELIEAKQSQ